MPSRIEEWHAGEVSVQTELQSLQGANPTAQGLPERYTPRILGAPLVAVGAADSRGRLWTTVWGGQRGFAGRAPPDQDGDDEDDLVLQTLVAQDDPVASALTTTSTSTAAPAGAAVSMSALAIDLETRDRVKLAGHLVSTHTSTDTLSLRMRVAESLGNCPKYLNKKRVRPHDVTGARLLATGGQRLPDRAVRLLARADLFFLTTAAEAGMDTNHRGGAPGFMRLARNDDGGGVELVYPEYSGNRLYQTLGNMRTDARVGVVVPDFATGTALYATGTAELLVGGAAGAVMPRTKLAVRVAVAEWRLVEGGLPFRADVIDYSPYNPPVRLLATELQDGLRGEEQRDAQTTTIARLVGREVLTATTARFTFHLSSPRPCTWWAAGQHVTLDFSDALDQGWSHMRDHDPQSLNDDFVRTFTVSNPPAGEGSSKGQTMEITARRNGPATNLLWRYPLDHRVPPLEIPVMGFGGAESFRLAVPAGSSRRERQRLRVFVAGGVGITPVLAQAGPVLDHGAPFRLLWSLRQEDLALAVDTFDRVPGLADVTTLFVTGKGQAQALGAASVQDRRIGEGDLAKLRGLGTKFYLCAAPKLLGMLTSWLEGEEVVWEDFGY